MIRKILIGVVLGVLAVTLGVFLWARGVLGTDAARSAVAAQLTRALGQPVQIGGVGASIFPRVTLTLNDVAIGEPARITANRLAVGASLRALLSRRIEHASVRLTGARLELPLPEFAFADNAADDGSGAAVEIVSVDEILVTDAELVSGGRTLGADLEIVPHATGFAIRRLDLEAGGAVVHVTGRITDLAAPGGELAISAEALSLDELLIFATDFARGAGIGGASTAASARPITAPGGPEGTMAMSSMDVEVTIDAARATFGPLLLSSLSGHARVTPAAWTFDAVRFGVFDGQYDGALTLTLDDTPAFRLNAALAGLDMNAVTTFAGHPGVMTGRLSGHLDVSGRGREALVMLQSARGTARVDVVEGVVKNLGLARAVVLAGSGRAESEAAATKTPADEPFSRLGATMAIAGGSGRTQDLRFESLNLLLSAAGSLALDGSALDLEGQIQLSEALTARAGRDLVRYTQQDGRVTLPVTIRGSIAQYKVGIDLVDLTKRAIINRATEEAEEAIRKGLGGLIGR